MLDTLRLSLSVCPHSNLPSRRAGWQRDRRELRDLVLGAVEQHEALPRRHRRGQRGEVAVADLELLQALVLAELGQLVERLERQVRAARAYTC